MKYIADLKWPDVYAFGYVAGPVKPWFAWCPVRLWYGQWAWMKRLNRARIVKRGYLPGPDWSFWTYTDSAALKGETP